jgi:hypothetical protein
MMACLSGQKMLKGEARNSCNWADMALCTGSRKVVRNKSETKVEEEGEPFICL